MKVVILSIIESHAFLLGIFCSSIVLHALDLTLLSIEKPYSRINGGVTLISHFLIKGSFFAEIQRILGGGLSWYSWRPEELLKTDLGLPFSRLIVFEFILQSTCPFFLKICDFRFYKGIWFLFVP